ncbi:aldo/keto reductase [Aliarcobacter skirrowii]|uniref:Aldo/keto reductase n=1 Tax=Aliarcobacter skirrowii CCUG 10374 TaxID=1032239 RepID=A0AAD0SLQ3_9BACT|nr:aldo/keto reductase [Aliarcobacter skirrowii]AXX84968.1 aldo/keto reductase [Aliarcobacter skirrowii CCUG 10374]KAB0620869.1 aldo/keto reductase [Aliarcobacter skirrowii CCUG 10374]RXI25787.1 aldo/keto reductase [Aliarcobacter skirrowii CCUG 10374]SUU96509.1 putative aldo-keto reductase [Aliarcobacter skirrowii]
MEFRYIGKSGLRVSSICMGTMTFGSSTDEKEAFKILDMAYDRGINFYDTAELYPVSPKKETIGLTEAILAKWLKTKARDSIILATKIAGAASGWFVPPVRHGLTAIDSFHIKRAIEGSLKRLQVDYIDLYQMHWPDTIVPIEESLKAFDALVKEGKVRYIGTSNDSAYGLTKANEISKNRNLARFESIQNNFSLLNPRFHDELANVCRRENISLLPYSPMAGGVLSGKYNKEFVDPDVRFAVYLKDKNKRVQAMAHRFVNEKTLEATAKYMSLANDYGVSPLTLAVAYSKHFDFVASTIIGARKSEQLEDSFKAFDFKITPEILTKIEDIQKEILYPMG